MSSPTRAPARVIASPAGISPRIVTQRLSGPRVVSPPTSSTACSSANARKPRANAASHCRIAVRQRQREQRPLRCRTHRGDVGQVDGEGLVANGLGIGIRKKMASAHQHVHGGHDDMTRCRREQRRIVADTQYHRWRTRRPGEESRDQFELVHGPIIGWHRANKPRTERRRRARLADGVGPGVRARRRPVTRRRRHRFRGLRRRRRFRRCGWSPPACRGHR